MADTGFDWTSLAKLAIAAYAANNASKNNGKFTQVPEDPSLTAIRKKVLGFVDNSPTRDMFAGLIQPRLASAQGWTAPPSKYGYDAGSAPAPKYDLSKLFVGGVPAAPAATGSGPAGNTSAKAALSGPNAAQAAPPPNKDIVFDDEFGGSGGPKDGQSIYDYLTQNPGGSVGKYLPNQGQSDTTPYQNFNNSPEMAALQQEYGSNADGQKLLQMAMKFGPSILLSYFTGSLAPIAIKIYNTLTNKGQTPPSPPPPTGPPPPDEP